MRKYYLLILFLPVLAFARTNHWHFLSVPFANFTLQPGQTIQAGYTIGQHRIIFCFENNLQNVGVISWPYRGQLQVGQLPIFLKTDANFQGEFADNSGTIAIFNNQSILLIVSCVFGF